MLIKRKKVVFQNSTKDRMTHLNISVAAKRLRDNKTDYLKSVEISRQSLQKY